jgi:hypothetical protein
MDRLDCLTVHARIDLSVEDCRLEWTDQPLSYDEVKMVDKTSPIPIRTRELLELYIQIFTRLPERRFF